MIYIHDKIYEIKPAVNKSFCADLQGDIKQYQPGGFFVFLVFGSFLKYLSQSLLLQIKEIL